MAATLAFFVVRHTLIDDAFITLSYARNFAFHFHWGLTPAETANSATSALNVVVLGAALRVVRDPTWAVGVIFVSAISGFSWCIARTVTALRLPAYTAILAVSLVLVNPLLLSVVGMETTTVVPLILAILLMAAVEERPWLFAIAAGFALLTRLDLAIFVFGVLVMTSAVRRRWRLVTVVAVTLAAPWYVLSWAFLGSAIPDTLAIKTEQAWLHSFITGPSFYAGRNGIAVVAAFLPVVCGLAVLTGAVLTRLAGRRAIPPESMPVIGFGLAGVAYWVAYALLDPPPYLWYYGPTILTVTLSGLLLLSLAQRARSGSTSRGHRTFMIVAISALAVLELGVVARDGTTWSQPAIVGNIVASSDYERIGRSLHRRFGGARIAIRGEIGALAYFCECEVLDQFSDRGITLPFIQRTIGGHGPVSRLLLTLNYMNLDRSRLPRHAEYYLEAGPEPPAGRNSWPTRVIVTGKVEHLTLRRNPADRAIVSDLTDQLLRGLGAQRSRLVLRADVNFVSTLYEIGIARVLRERSVDVVLHHPGAHGIVVTVATGEEVDTALLGNRHVLAYRGQVPLAERTRLARRAHRLTRQHRAGQLSDLDFFYAIGDLRHQVRPEVVVFR